MERSILRQVDPFLAGATLLLSLAGLAMIYSATNKTLSTFEIDPGFYLKKQAVYLLIALGVMIVTALVDYRLVKAYAPLAYVGSIALLVLVQTPLGTAS